MVTLAERKSNLTVDRVLAEIEATEKRNKLVAMLEIKATVEKIKKGIYCF